MLYTGSTWGNFFPMRNYKRKPQRGLCAWYGCTNQRQSNSALCEIHARQIELPLARKGRVKK